MARDQNRVGLQGADLGCGVMSRSSRPKASRVMISPADFFGSASKDPTWNGSRSLAFTRPTLTFASHVFCAGLEKRHGKGTFVTVQRLETSLVKLDGYSETGQPPGWSMIPKPLAWPKNQPLPRPPPEFALRSQDIDLPGNRRKVGDAVETDHLTIVENQRHLAAPDRRMGRDNLCRAERPSRARLTAPADRSG